MKNILELEEAQEPEGNNLMVVDCFNLAFRYKHSGEFDMKVPLLRTIRSLAKSYSASKVIILSDWGSSTFRREIYDRYKRREHSNSPEEVEKFEKFINGFNEALEMISQFFPIIKLKNVEADDLAGYIVKKYKNKFDNVWLISTDKDWDQLLDTNVHRFSFYTRKEYKVENMYETHGCDTPEEFTSMKVLMGDPGDTVPGIHLVGQKRAYNLIREYGSALDIYMAIPLPGKQQVVQNINLSADLIMRNYHLMDILTYCEEAINHPNKENLEWVDSYLEEHLT